MSLDATDFPLFKVEDRDGWQRISTKRVFDNPHISVDEVSCLTPHRQDAPVPWLTVQRKAAVAIAPMTEDGHFVLISQERIPVQQTLWEFPAGQIDVPLDEITPEIVVDTALRELLEETGYALTPDAELEPLGWFLPSQGFTDEHVYLFQAKPVCVVSRPTPDGSEHISDVRLVSSGELRRMIAANEITTALTLALYARMAAKGTV
jgi:8-oxo-dGTP pyrophosphatase MutT (NUDIX family)